MIKAIIYKEWLKIRWAFYAMLLVFVLTLIYVVLNLDYGIRFSEAHNYWYNVIFRHLMFYSGVFTYVPAVAGVTLAITQFYPEINSKRLKLTFHLPLHEDKAMMAMIAVGSVALTIIYLAGYLMLTIITSIYFPVEILYSVLTTSLPWFLAGYVCYWAVSMIFVEPKWIIKRIALLLLTYGFINQLFYLQGYNLFNQSIHWFILLSLFFSISIIFSAYRFRKGVM